MKNRPGSPTESCVSMRSDKSKDHPPMFNEAEHHIDQSVMMKRSGSPTQSCVSMRSDRSKDPPPYFKEKPPSDKRSMDSGHVPSQSSWSVSSGSVMCDVGACSGSAVKCCLTCMASYCEIHVKDHHTSPDLDSHELQDLHHHNLCPQHHKRLKFYCRTDQSTICSRCFLHDHNGHDVIEQTVEKTPSENFMRKGVPSPGPIQFESVQSDTVSLRWSPPEGAPGHRTFKVTWIGGQKHCNFPVTDVALEVTDLIPGEKYHFTVATLSQDGRQSTPVEGAVHTEVPPPQNLQVEVTPPTATVIWNDPDGVDQVTYLLEIIKDTKDKRTIQRETCDYTITGLQTPAHYTINVTTVLSNGRQSQPASATFRAVVPPPQNVKVDMDLKSGTASVSWTEPAGVDQVTYLLQIIKDQKEIRTVHRNSFNCTVTGLEVDADCTINITTVLSNGSQSQPAIQTFRAEGSADVPPPGPVQLVSVGPDSVSLRWSPPEGDHGHNTYKVTWTEDQRRCIFPVTGTTLDWKGLTPGEKYNFTVATVSQDGRQSTPVEVEVYPVVPPPRYVRLGVNLESLTIRVTWDKPTGVDHVTFLLEIINNQGYKHTIQTHSCHYNITDLQMFVNYTISVTTVHNNGRHSKPVIHIFRPGPPLRMILIGKSGAGKSQSGNSILGHVYFSRASECKELSTLHSRQIKVIDTPAIFHTSRHETIITNDILDCIRLSRPGPHAFLLVIKLGHFTREEQNAVRALQEIFGEKVKDHIIILFTHGDELDGQTIEEYVSSGSEELQKLIRSCGGRFHVFDNKEREGSPQVAKLLKKIDEMVAANGGEHYSDEMYEETTRVMEERNLKWDSDSSDIDQHLSFLPLLKKRVVQFHKTLSQ